jgi:TldD protein
MAPRGRFETPVEVDPFAIPLEQKIGDLLAADEAMRRVEGIAFADTTFGAQREEKTFAASDGSFTEQTITHVGAGIEANAVDGDEHQRRSYPEAGGAWQGAGYEYARSLDLAGTAERIATEAVQLLSAPQLPPGRRTIVLQTARSWARSGTSASRSPTSTRWPPWRRYRRSGGYCAANSARVLVPAVRIGSWRFTGATAGG